VEKKVDFPSDREISERAFDLFFQERDAPGVFDDYRRRAEAELLERAYQAIARCTYDRGRYRPGR
jgi:hypothetical protein